MLLSDRRLKFARGLIQHWLDIRRGALVPLEEDIDPRELLPLLSFLSVADVALPDAATMELVGQGVRRRYGQDIRKTDWFAFIVPEQRAAADEAKRLFISVPCGAYYRFTISVGGERMLEAESLSLPLRRRGDTNPGVSISLTRDIEANEVSGAASATQCRVEGVFAEFVDIGAGAPAFPSATPH